MASQARFSPEVRERGARMVQGSRAGYQSRRQAMPEPLERAAAAGQQALGQTRGESESPERESAKSSSRTSTRGTRQEQAS